MLIRGNNWIIFPSLIFTCLLSTANARSVVGDAPRGPPVILSNEVKPLQIVQLGQEFRIICPIEGDPTPIIDWYKDGESITPAWSPRFRVNGRTLRIRSMYSEDAGIYECKGVNGFGSQMARTRIIVSDEEMVNGDEKFYNNHPSNSNDRRRESAKGATIPPKFTPETTEQTGPLHVTYGNTIRLRCEAKGTPAPKINWLKNGKSVGDKLWKWSSWTLILSKLSVEDSGVYTCIANSTAGKIELNIQLYVTEMVEKRRPELATGDPNNTTVMVGNEAVLECIVRASLSTLPPHIKWLKRVPDDDYYSKSSISGLGGGGGRHKHRLLPNDNHHVLVIQETQDKGIRITESQRNGTFISKLIIAKSDPSHSGSYICLATNSAGYSFKEIAVLKVAHSDGPTALTNPNSSSTSSSTTLISFPILVIVISLIIAMLMVGGACILRKYQENQPKQLSKSIVPKKLSSSTSSNGTSIPLPSIIIGTNNYNSSPSKYHHQNHHRHSMSNNKNGLDCHQLLVSTTSAHSSSSSSGGHDQRGHAGINHFVYNGSGGTKNSISTSHKHLHHHHHHHGRKIGASDNPAMEMTLSKCNCFDHESIDMDDHGSRIYEQCHNVIPSLGSGKSNASSYCGHWT